MVATIPNISKGRINQYASKVANNDPANSALVIVLLQGALVSTIDELRDLDTLAAILLIETECDFTNYDRIVLTDADVNDPTPDDVGNSQSFDIADQSILAAGGVADNNVGGAVICYDPDSTVGTDADLIPCYVWVHDVQPGESTNGETLHVRVDALGLWTAEEPV